MLSWHKNLPGGKARVFPKGSPGKYGTVAKKERSSAPQAFQQRSKEGSQ
jgi:hypothetical protein